MTQLINSIFTHIAIFIFPMSLVGYSFYSLAGAMGFFIAASLLSLTSLILGDRWILFLSSSIPLASNHKLWETSLNLASVIDLKPVNLYVSHVYPNCFICVTSLFGRPSIIIGNNIFKMLSETELTSLMVQSMNYLKSRPAYWRVQTSLVLSLVIWPSTFRFGSNGYRKKPKFIRRWLLGPILKIANALVLTYRFIIFPIGVLKSKLLRSYSIEKMISGDNVQTEILMSAIAKINLKSKDSHEKNFSYLALEDLALIPFNDKSSFVFNHYTCKTS